MHKKTGPRKRIIITFLCTVLAAWAQAQTFVTGQAQPGAIDISRPTLFVDGNDVMLVKKAAALLQADLALVTGSKPSLQNHFAPTATAIIIGSADSSALIKKLAQQKKISLEGLKGKWEGYRIQTVKNPVAGIANALVIVGSDRRGTAYGVFELSKQLGVSPWYWWADVPVQKKDALYVKANTLVSDAPQVKYRGIFINDEAPALSNWSREKFGGFNHLFYEKVFELILRLRGNYLWPAMWGNAFYADDPLNRATADAYGIVIGTSHHEPLMRAHDEWRRFGTGKWNYDSNAARLQQFWKEGMERATNEKIVSVGMRGDGDEPMSRETATALLERIVRDQRAIIESVTGKPAEQTPQLWAPYKEVQDYYDKGMRVPDDVTLLLCDDNWGNIRTLPKPGEKQRKGGYGIYYHFDYVGGPRNYKWINTNNIARVWEQLHLAWEYKARQIWIVNVGDIKPMEFPTSFFLDYAWNPQRWNEDNLRDYYTQWAAQQFGTTHARAIGAIIRQYSQYNARRKPELLAPNTYSLTAYNEAGSVVEGYKKLLEEAEAIAQKLPAGARDAYFQLVLHPVMASANLNDLYVAAALNRYHAQLKEEAANGYAAKVKELYEKDSLITLQYHRIAGGKWNHMMDQTHIGYTYWQQPPVNKMPAVVTLAPSEISEPGPLMDSIARTAEDLLPKGAKGPLFYEFAGFVSIEAEHWTRAVNAKGIRWKVIPDIGRTASGISPFPVTAAAQQPGPGSAHLAYDLYTYDTGAFTLHAYCAPTLNFQHTGGLRYAVSIDGDTPQIVTINRNDGDVKTWEKWVADNIIITATDHRLTRPGKHTLKFWMVDPGIVLQKLVLDFGGMQPSYLGPPETKIEP